MAKTGAGTAIILGLGALLLLSKKSLGEVPVNDYFGGSGGNFGAIQTALSSQSPIEKMLDNTPRQNITYSPAFSQQASKSLKAAGIKRLTGVVGPSGITNVAEAGITTKELKALNKRLPRKSSSGGRTRQETFKIGGKTLKTNITVKTSSRGSDGLTSFERATTGKRAI